MNKWSRTYLLQKNLHFMSVYCQTLLSTAVSMRISFFLLDFFLSLSLKCLYFLSLSLLRCLFLTFYCSLIFSVFYHFSFSLSFNWIMITFSFLNLFEKKWNLSHYYVYPIRRKNALFWNARRKLDRVNSNTLEFQSLYVCLLTEGFWNIYIKGKRKTHSFTWSKREEAKREWCMTTKECRSVTACDEASQLRKKSNESNTKIEGLNLQ
jgi:hypothetical protein